MMDLDMDDVQAASLAELIVEDVADEGKEAKERGKHRRHLGEHAKRIRQRVCFRSTAGKLFIITVLRSCF